MNHVRTADDITPHQEPGSALAVHRVREADDATGLRQEVLRSGTGVSASRSPGPDRVEVLFVVAGEGTLWIGPDPYPLRPEIAVFIGPGESYQLDVGAAGMELVSVSSPDTPDLPSGDRQRIIDLAEQVDRDAVSERQYRLLFEPDAGCAPLTQFIGYIPPIRTPLHYHDYSEMVYVVSGSGQVEIGGDVSQIGPGSSFYLPAGCHHLVENLGTDYLRLHGVFRPAGSPAIAHPVHP